MSVIFDGPTAARQMGLKASPELVDSPVKSTGNSPTRRSRRRAWNLEHFGAPVSVLAQPSVIHFPHFTLNETHRIVVTLLNRSSDRVRTQITAPASPNFTLKCQKKGALVPGQTETMTVEFMPDSWRYYYDCIRVRTSNDELLIVPIHCYPIMNDVMFPKKISFGLAPISETQTKIIPLRCKVPIDFEFELNLIEPHPFITIWPLKGIVPGCGQADIHVTFTPLAHITAISKMEVNIAQFGFVPFVCEIWGSSLPCHVRELVLEREKQKRGKQRQRTGPRSRRRSRRSDEAQPACGLALDASSPATVGATAEGHGGVDQLEDTEEPTNCMEISVGTTGLVSARRESSNVHTKHGQTQRKQKDLEAAQIEEEIIAKANFERSKELHRFVCHGEHLPDDDELEAFLTSRAQREARAQTAASKSPYVVHATHFASSSKPVTEMIRTRRVDGRGSPPRPASGESTGATGTRTPVFANGGLAATEWERRARSFKRLLLAARAVVVRCRMKKRLLAITTFLEKTGFDRGAVPNGNVDAVLEEYFGRKGPSPEDVAADRLVKAFEEAVQNLGSKLTSETWLLPNIVTPGVIDLDLTPVHVDPPEHLPFPAPKPLESMHQRPVTEARIVGNTHAEAYTAANFVMTEPHREMTKAPEDELDEYFRDVESEEGALPMFAVLAALTVHPDYPPGHIYNPAPHLEFYYNPQNQVCESDREYPFLPPIHVQEDPRWQHVQKTVETHRRQSDSAALELRMVVEELSQATNSEAGMEKICESGYRGTESDTPHIPTMLPYRPVKDPAPAGTKADGTSTNLLYPLPATFNARAFVESSFRSPPKNTISRQNDVP